MHEAPEDDRPLTTESVFELLDRGREVRLSDDPPMPGSYVLFTSTVTLRRVGHGADDEGGDGEFHVHTYIVCHDGSCTSGSTDETLDRAATRELVTRLLAEGLV